MFNLYITLKTNNTYLVMFQEEDACALFWDSSNLYPDLDHVFHPSNWNLIYTQYVPRAAAPSPAPAPAVGAGAADASAPSPWNEYLEL